VGGEGRDDRMRGGDQELLGGREGGSKYTCEDDVRQRVQLQLSLAIWAAYTHHQPISLWLLRRPSF